MTSKIFSTLSIIMLGGSVSGCLVNARARGSIETTPVVVSDVDVVLVEPAPQVIVFREPPQLVLVEPNVYVVGNAGYAIYYVDGYYWHLGGAGWSRSRYWDEPWINVEINIVPSLVVHRDHRHYVRFKANKTAHVWREPKVHLHADAKLKADVKVKSGPSHDSHDAPKVDHDRPTPARVIPTPDDNRKPKVEHDDKRPKVEHDDKKPRVEQDAPKIDVKKKSKAKVAPKKPKVAPTDRKRIPPAS